MQNHDIPLFDIYEYMYVPFWQRSWFFYVKLALVGLMVGVILLLIWFFRRQKKHIKMAWQVALEQLHSLDYRKVKHKEFYFRLTSILKTYLAIRYGIQLKDKTDLEVIDILGRGALPDDLQELVKEIFSAPLFIKFANEQVCIERMKEDIARCVVLIEQSKLDQGA